MNKPLAHTRPDKAMSLALELLQVELEVRRAGTMEELGFIMVNRSMSLLPAATIYFWQGSPQEGIRIIRGSGVAEINLHAPAVQWAGRVVRILAARQDARQISPVHAMDLNDPEKSDWSDLAPPYGLWCPLVNMDGAMPGGLWLLKNQPWLQEEVALATRLAETFVYTWDLLIHKRLATSGMVGIRRMLRRKSWLFLPLCLLGFLPVNLSVLAPALVVAKDPWIVTAPMDGVVESILVKPNEPVQVGQQLLQLETTAIQNHLVLAKKALHVAEAELLRSRQLAFTDPLSQDAIPLLQARIEQQASDVTYAQQRLDQTLVRATQAGLALYKDPGKWRGKPVVVGQKIMTIADPDQAELDIRLPVDDAVILEPGAEIRFFLNVDPTNPLTARLQYASFEASMAPEGYLAHQVVAQLPDGVPPPRLGLRGSAKILGKKVSLFYFLFRRPISYLRRTLGY